jgi:glutamine amidotransferase
VAVVDYGMGNLRSVAQAVIHATTDTHVNAVITPAPQVRAAHRVVLPGQGAMADCMRELRESGLLESVLEAAATKPLFGVCVGMQMLLDHSAEGHTAAGTPGLGLIPGEVLKFDLAGQPRPTAAATRCRKWAGTACTKPQPHPVWGGVPDGELVLLRAQLLRAPLDARHSVGETEYGGRFTAAMARDNIFATQFHPEKSADQGLALYRNFLHWNPDLALHLLLAIAPCARPSAGLIPTPTALSTSTSCCSSRHRPQGRPLRAPATRRHGPGHHLQRRPRRHGRALARARARAACIWWT